jgi:hypothetical protein
MDTVYGVEYGGSRRRLAVGELRAVVVVVESPGPKDRHLEEVPPGCAAIGD